MSDHNAIEALEVDQEVTVAASALKRPLAFSVDNGLTKQTGWGWGELTSDGHMRLYSVVAVDPERQTVTVRRTA